MAPRRIASGSVFVLLVAAVLIAVGGWVAIANWEDRPVALATVAIMVLSLLAMLTGARQAAQHERETRRP